MQEAHYGIAGGHYASETTSRKFGTTGYRGQLLQKDVVEYLLPCDLCQRTDQPTKRDRMPHQLVVPLQTFQKWGLDFAGPFKPAMTRTSNQYIIFAAGYCTKWVEAKAIHEKRTPLRQNLYTNTVVVDSNVPSNWLVTTEVTLSTRRFANLRLTMLSYIRI